MHKLVEAFCIFCCSNALPFKEETSRGESTQEKSLLRMLVPQQSLQDLELHLRFFHYFSAQIVSCISTLEKQMEMGSSC
jgi:hypothetical protein